MLMSEIFINTLHSVDLFERNEGRFRSTREINKYHELATVHSPRENWNIASTEYNEYRIRMQPARKC